MNSSSATCAKCGKPVVILSDGKPKRSCGHEDAGVNLLLSATVYGESAIAAGNPKAIKLAKPG